MEWGRAAEAQSHEYKNKQREKLNSIVINILNTNKLFNFELKFEEGSFKKGIPTDANSYFYSKALSLGLQLRATQIDILPSEHYFNVAPTQIVFLRYSSFFY